MSFIFHFFFQLLKFCDLHWEYCSTLAFGLAVYTTITERIRAVNHTLVVNHV